MEYLVCETEDEKIYLSYCEAADEWPFRLQIKGQADGVSQSLVLMTEENMYNFLAALNTLHNYFVKNITLRYYTPQIILRPEEIPAYETPSWIMGCTPGTVIDLKEKKKMASSEIKPQVIQILSKLNKAYAEIMDAEALASGVLPNNAVGDIDATRNDLVKVIDELWQNYIK